MASRFDAAEADDLLTILLYLGEAQEGTKGAKLYDEIKAELLRRAKERDPDALDVLYNGAVPFPETRELERGRCL